MPNAAGGASAPMLHSLALRPPAVGMNDYAAGLLLGDFFYGKALPDLLLHLVNFLIRHKVRQLFAARA